MTRRILMCLLALAAAIALHAQKEQDFASRFMEINDAEGNHLTCNTVSPTMMQRLLSFTEGTDSERLQPVLKQVKSIRTVTNKHAEKADNFYEKALQLANSNNKRYKLYADKGNTHIYIRKRGRIIVEIVLITTPVGNLFTMVDITGNMDDDFMTDLLKI